MNCHFTLRWTLLILLGLRSLAPVQAQAVDPSFAPTLLKASQLAPITPQLVVAQPDGKVLVGGNFDYINGTLAGRIQRLNADGSTDQSFNPGGLGANGFLAAMVIQPDGKILIGGGFTTYNNTPRLSVARLNADGTLDPTFAPTGITSRRQVTALALQADGKILVGSGPNLDVATSTPNSGLTRLNPDGTPDDSFDLRATGSFTVNGGFVRALLVQADGRILVGGGFNGQQVDNLVRLNASGSPDPSFSFRLSARSGATVRVLASQANGKILVGGLLPNSNDQLTSRLVRLLPGGELDNTFTVGSDPNNTVLSLLVQPGGPQSDERILVGGAFTQFNGQVHGRLVRLFNDGSLDAAFAAGSGANGAVTSLAQLSGGRVLAGGNFSQYDNLPATGLVQLTPTGATDPSFTVVAQARGTISSVAPLSNGQLLISGNISEFNGIALPANTVRRVNFDGSLDQTYTTTASGPLYGAQPDGTFYTRRSLTFLQSELVRILPSGEADDSFTSQPFGLPTTARIIPTPVINVVTQLDGRLLVFGAFTTYGNAQRNGIARLYADGSLDDSFTPPVSLNLRQVTAVVAQASGKLVISYREFGADAGIGSTLLRLNADGSLDNTFAINAAGTSATVFEQPDKRLLVTGSFTSFNGQAAPYGIVRLEADGTFVSSLSGLTSRYIVRAIQPDNRILVTTGIGGATTLLRLNTDGSSDNTFAPVALPSGIFIGDDLLSGVTQQLTDGKVILYGAFRVVTGQLRTGLARLTNPVATSTAHSAAATLPLVVYPNPAQQQLTAVLPAAAQSRPATLLALTGRTVRRWLVPARQPEVQLDLTTVPAGIYLLRITDATRIYQQRIVVTP